jgi:alkyl hydroperoxide reductase subunit D
MAAGTLDALRDALPDVARDVRLNLGNLLQGGQLETAQRWGVAIAVALAARDAPLARALIDARPPEVEAPVVDDARAAAALMATTASATSSARPPTPTCPPG